VGLVALTLLIVGIVLVNRMDDYFLAQTQVDLNARRNAVEQVVINSVDPSATGSYVVSPSGQLNPSVIDKLSVPANERLLADLIAQADLHITFGQATQDSAGDKTLVPANGGQFDIARVAKPKSGQNEDAITTTTPTPLVVGAGTPYEYALQVTLSDPYTFRASAVANVVGLLAVVGMIALGFAVVIAAFVAQRLTDPLRRLTDASRAIAEGDYTSRVPADLATAGAAEIAELSRQFNVMAGRLGESVDIIRRDRDRSRDFLADVSHELRTPIAAMRTFNELLREGAADDPAARAEFLESSRQQLERLDWLAQNLLDLSKLDSGLVLLDLREDDLRACVESAVEQAQPSAQRRGVLLTAELPTEPLLVRHDAQRMGQVVSNLVGNALKFTPRGGSVHVRVLGRANGGLIEVADTGVGIDPSELPRIFDRFYRGSRANEARGSGSGLGLAIVKSIVDMHLGRVTVESHVGEGTTFSVTVPAEPVRSETGIADADGGLDPDVSTPATPAGGPGHLAPLGQGVAATGASKMADSSPSPGPSLNAPHSG
jgi:signal transduction histidine kinase